MGTASAPARADQTKANNNTALNDANSWGGATPPGAVPTAADVIIFGGEMTTPNVSANNAAPDGPAAGFGADLAVKGIQVGNGAGSPAKNSVTGKQNGVAIGNFTANTPANAFLLTLGSSGIDMSTSTTPFQVGAKVLLSADQTWNVPDASATLGAATATTFTTGNANSPFALSQKEDLVFRADASAPSTVPASGTDGNFAFNLGGKTLTTTGLGTIVIHSGYNVAAGTINIGNGDNTINLNGGGNINHAFDIQSGGTRNSSVGSDVTLNVATTLRFQSNSGGVVSNATINLGFNGTSAVGGAILNLVGASNTAANNVNVAGPVVVQGSSTIQVANSPANGANTQPILITGNISGAGALSFQTTSTGVGNLLVLSGNNSGYTGTATINGPSGNRLVRLSTSTAGSAAATWRVDTANTLQAAGTISVDLGTLNNGPGGGGTIVNPLAGTATLNVGAGSFGGTISTGTGAVAVNKVTGGTLTLSGPNTYTGGTTITAGTLAAGTDAALGGAAAPLSIGAGTFNATASYSTARPVTLTAASSTVLVDPTFTVVHGGAFGGTGSLTKSGTGTLQLTAVANYAGNTTVSGGTLIVGNSSALPATTNLSVTGTAAANFQNISQTVASISTASGTTVGLTAGTTLNVGGGTLAGTVNSTSPALLNHNAAATLTISADAGPNLSVTAGGAALTSFTAAQHLVALSVGAGATAAGQSVNLFTKSVAITGGPAAPTGKIDLKAGNLVVTYGTGGSTRGGVEQLVAFGALNANSAGIVTSAGTPGGLTLGVADTADVGGITLYNSGATIPANSVVVRYTYAGDATLDGSVDTADLGVMLDNFGALADPGGRQWSIGDVNYDASVDTADLGLALDNFGQLAGSGAVQAALAGLGFTLADGVETGVANGQAIRFALTGAALPEPASLGLIGVGAMTLLGRRRRRA